MCGVLFGECLDYVAFVSMPVLGVGDVALIAAHGCCLLRWWRRLASAMMPMASKTWSSIHPPSVRIAFPSWWCPAALDGSSHVRLAAACESLPQCRGRQDGSLGETGWVPQERRNGAVILSDISRRTASA